VTAIGPPKDVPPERLFRFLMAKVPERALVHRIAGLPDIELFVRAVPGAVFEALRDDAALPDVPMVELSRTVRSWMAATLWTRGGRLATSGDELGRLSARVLLALLGAWVEAVNLICPTFGRSDTRAWRKVLVEGAVHPSNERVAERLAYCGDPLVLPTKIAWVTRPERYWSMPPDELLDGHVLCFEAARKAMGVK
jgi:hypothetical protein